MPTDSSRVQSSVGIQKMVRHMAAAILLVAAGRRTQQSTQLRVHDQQPRSSSHGVSTARRY
eukprot:COSAG01_NODE_69368_length_261_cov_1.265432_1_plen_60_part_01